MHEGEVKLTPDFSFIYVVKRGDSRNGPWSERTQVETYQGLVGTNPPLGRNGPVWNGPRSKRAAA